MNYIRHLNQVMECFAGDKRIIPRHISMYMALFFLWNKFKFPATIYFARSELMPLSKIGSMRYYHLTLHELHEWGYIDYRPSKSVFQGSGVTMRTCFNSDTSGETTSGTTSACSTATSSKTSTGTSSSTSSATTSGAININTNKPVINTKETVENKSERASDAPTQNSNNEVSGSKKATDDNTKRFHKPTLDALESYFESKGALATEAQRFFNHFESNGWKVGGKSPMKDWQAAARNWILNMDKYQRTQPERAENPLATSNDKDYGEPL
jgi:hypothetical protein